MPQSSVPKDIHPENLADWLYHQFFHAYLAARKHKRSTEDEHKFEINAAENIRILVQDVMRREYKPSPGIAFIVLNPVVREIFAAPFRDRVIHHFIYNMVADWWDTRFIQDSYSCRKGKGTLFGIKRLEHHMRSVSNDYKEEAYVIKLDVSGYFMSLDHDLLYERAMWGLNRQFPDGGELYRILKYLWHEVIYDDPTDGVKLVSPIKHWELVPATKCFGCQPENRGIVIGNLTSQLLSNIFMDQVDRFIKYHLGYNHYGRYVDDLFIVVPAHQYEQAKRDVKVIENYMNTLHLTLHPKKRVYRRVDQGIPFLGTVVYPNKLYPDKRFRNNFKEAVWKYKRGFATYDQMISYIGHMTHLDGDYFISQLFEKNGLEFVMRPIGSPGRAGTQEYGTTHPK